ncbi:MAG: shikimate dehydrogenase [Candidatus Brocadiia bacterium]
MTDLCVPLIEETAEGMAGRIQNLPPNIDMVEIRADYLKVSGESLRGDIAGLIRNCALPVIVTNRPEREGGCWTGPENDRLDLLRTAATEGADYIDIELDSVGELGEISGSCGRIVSYHNFDETPDDLMSIHQKARRAGADVVKIAVQARSIKDTGAVFTLLEKHAQETPTIALSMGEEGIATRVLAGKFGGFLTFTSLKRGKESARGQIPCDDMAEMYGFHEINPSTEVYGVVANPVAHSMSPAIHNAAFRKLGMDAVYLPFRVDNPGEFLAIYRPRDLRGLSVTIPHKQTMLGLMDEVDELSERIGAVNTVDIRDGRLYGSNTDVAAAVNALEAAAREAELTPLSELCVLLVGAGGASRALAYGLVGRVGEIVIANRTVQRAKNLAAELGVHHCGLDDMGDYSPDIIINATSVGMHPDTQISPVPSSMLQSGMVVFDAVYNPIKTRLLEQAEEAGCIIASGFEWFVSQAAAQFETWTDRDAPRDVMARVVRERLSGS